MSEIATGVWAYLADREGWGWSNAALIAGSEGEGLLFDTRMTVGQGRELVDAATRHAPVLTHAVYSHGNADHTWGSVALSPETAVLCSAATAAELPTEITPNGLQSILDDDSAPQGSASAYFREHLSVFDLTGLPGDGPRRPDVTYTGRRELTVGGREVELLQVGPAHTAGDTVAHVPDAGVVCAGDVLFFTDHPISWGHPLSGWLRALRTLLDTGATVFVPGHGPVVGRTEVHRLLSYLEHLGAYAAETAAAGVPLVEAAARMPTDPQWQQPERAASVLLAGYRDAGATEHVPQLEVTAAIAQLDARQERAQARARTTESSTPGV